MGERADWANNASKEHHDAESRTLLSRDTDRRFHALMDNAMLVSAYKYGPVAEAYPERVNAIQSLNVRLAKYIETGNVEYLVDVANFAMIEFMHPAHGNAHYKATDADGSPGRVAANTAIYDTPNQFKNSDLADKDERPTWLVRDHSENDE